jgi:hypothetical protein
MHTDQAMQPGGERRYALNGQAEWGLTIFGGLAGLNALTAAVLMWLVLTQPARTMVAATDGAPEMLRLLFITMYEVIVHVLSWV